MKEIHWSKYQDFNTVVRENIYDSARHLCAKCGHLLIEVDEGKERGKWKRGRRRGEEWQIAFSGEGRKSLGVIRKLSILESGIP